MPLSPKTLDVLAWNVYIGHRPEKVRGSLGGLLAAYQPEVAALMEASRLYGHLTGLGYKVVQLKPRASQPGNQPETGNIAILVREDVQIVKRLTQRMREFWTGPKHGWPHDPRVNRSVKIRVDGTVWKVKAGHGPFGDEAKAEFQRRLARWLTRAVTRPTVLVLDANMSHSEFRTKVAGPGGAKTGGVGVDLIAYKNAALLSARNLGKNGSDHPAMLYRLKR